MLSERRQRVLRALIEDYIQLASPVGSRALTERHRLGVSPATIRNDLSALEDAGYIRQPHTSAGRIPTDAGYRTFVDDLLQTGFSADEAPHQDIVDELRASATELDALLEQTSAALARLTNCLSIVTAPSLFSGHIRQITLVSLSNWQSTIIVVTEDGRVANKTVSFAEEVTCDTLARVQNLLNDVLVGRSAREVRRNLNQGVIDALRDPLVQLIIDEIIDCLHEGDGGHAHRLGLSSLLRQPEFSESKSLAPFMEALEDERLIMHTFEDADHATTPVLVKIGHENAAAEFSDMSVVASTFGRGEDEGLIAVIGPTRMDYSRVIAAVRAAQSALKEE